VKTYALSIVAFLLLGLINGAGAVTFNTGTVFQTGSGSVSVNQAISVTSAVVNDTWVMFQGFNSVGTLGISSLGCNIIITEATSSTISFTSSTPGIFGVVKIYSPTLNTPTVSGAWSSGTTDKTTLMVLLIGGSTVTLTYTAQSVNSPQIFPTRNYDLKIMKIESDNLLFSLLHKPQVHATLNVENIAVETETTIRYWVEDQATIHTSEGTQQFIAPLNIVKQLTVSLPAPSEPGVYTFCFQVTSPIVSEVITQSFNVEGISLPTIQPPTPEINTALLPLAATVLFYLYKKKR
jgi:hypothetical protein